MTNKKKKTSETVFSLASGFSYDGYFIFFGLLEYVFYIYMRMYRWTTLVLTSFDVFVNRSKCHQNGKRHCCHWKIEINTRHCIDFSFMTTPATNIFVIMSIKISTFVLHIQPFYFIFMFNICLCIIYLSLHCWIVGLLDCWFVFIKTKICR